MGFDPTQGPESAQLEPLFSTDAYLAGADQHAYDVHPDGQSFILLKFENEGYQRTHLVNNFDLLLAESLQNQ